MNLAHFGIPHFAEAFPDRYRQDWRALPREIPDSFVRKFGEWCHEHGVKGKYSIVPYPACTGWMDRDIPGWSKRELDDSLKLVRTLMAPDWDIHPEMISHTWVIDTKTGRPFPDRTDLFMENFRWTEGKSADQLADYMSYALRILKNVDLPCEGITTPGRVRRASAPRIGSGDAAILPRRLSGGDPSLLPARLHRQPQRGTPRRVRRGHRWPRSQMCRLHDRLYR